MGVTECENCGAELAPSDTVVVWWAARRGDIGNRFVPARGCKRCADAAWAEELARRGFSLRRALRLIGGEPELHARLASCHHCGREVAFMTATEYRTPYARRAYCSDPCRDASRKLARSRRPRPLGICETCGATFVPTRSDAKTCSPACRQKAYRQRAAAR